MKLPLCAAFLACLLPALAAAADDKAYAIKYHRRAEVGDVYTFSSTVSFERKPLGKTTAEELREGGAEQQEDGDAAVSKFAGSLLGTMKVQAVDSNGQPKEFELTIKSLKHGEDDEVVGEGTKIHVKRSADTVDYHDAGEENDPIDPDVAKVLNLFIHKLNEADATDDDIFRSNKTRKVGDKWEVDYDALENAAAGENIALDLKQTSLTATFKEVSVHDKNRAFVVTTEGKIKYKSMPLPPHLVFSSATSAVHSERIIPEDKNEKMSQYKLEAEITFKATRKSDGLEVSFKDVIKRSAMMRLEK